MTQTTNPPHTIIHHNLPRCDWAVGKPDDYLNYHDTVWGKPEHDERQLFKWLLLESFHTGLSWQTVLSKERYFAIAFDGYNYNIIAQYDEEKCQQLVENPQIIRHRGKINAAIANAKAFLQVQAEFGSFDAYIWQFTQRQSIRIPYSSGITRHELSDTVTHDMKKRGFKFIGSVTIYSYLQAIGIIDAHDEHCHCYREIHQSLTSKK